MIKLFLLEICPYVYYAPPLVGGRLHLVSCRERSCYCNVEDTEIREFGDKKKREMDENSNF